MHPSEEKTGLRTVERPLVPQHFWAIYSGRMVMPWTVRCTRREAIREVEKNHGKHWMEIKSRGYTCEKVTVIAGPWDRIFKTEP